MSNNSGSGSLILKLGIVLLAVLLVLVIKIPDSIWNEEKLEKSKSHFNMSSIYEAEKQYHRLTDQYTTNIDDLLREVRQDSSIMQTQQLVSYTQQLKRALENFLNIPYVNGLMTIDQNISTIIEDLNTNDRYFKIDENVRNEADQIKVELSVFSSEVKYPNYSVCTTYIDSIYQLRRDLTDYNLQTAAYTSARLSEKANEYLPNVEFDNIVTEWKRIAVRLENFRIMVNEPHISKNTSVGARIREFAGKINSKFESMATVNKSADIEMAKTVNQKFNDIYQTFLKDYLITSKRGLYRLSLEDSMVLYISEENFLSPVTQEQYKLIINNDSSDIKVESPLLLEELRGMVKPYADQIAGFEFLDYYFEYADTIRAIIDKGTAIKTALRRNLEITVKNAELKDNYSTYIGGSEFKAATELKKFVDDVNNSQSFSEIKESIDKARNAVGIFEQVYGGDIFSNIDSLNKDIQTNLEEYNAILSEIRRLPKDIEKFDAEPEQLNSIINKIKQKTSSNNPDKLTEIQSKLGEALLFATEGKTKRVYLVFEKSLENFGYVYKNTKSWEEEDEKEKK